MCESIFDQSHVETAREFYKRFSSLERQLRKRIELLELFHQRFDGDIKDERYYDKLQDLIAGVDLASAVFSGFILANRDHIKFV